MASVNHVGIACLFALSQLAFGAGVAAVPVEPIGPPDRWLEWTNNYNDQRDEFSRCGVTPAQATEWEHMLQRMARRVAQTKVDLPPGWYGDLRGHYYGPWLGALEPCKGLPMEGGLALALWPPQDLKRVPVPGRPGQTKLRPNGEAPFVDVYVNQWRGNAQSKWLDDGARPRMSVAQKSGEFGGYPVLDRRWLIVTPVGHGPAFVSAPPKRVLRAWLKNETALLQEVETSIKGLEASGQNPGRLAAGLGGLRARIARSAQWLASLDAEQRRAPAFFTRQEEIVAQPEPNAAQVWVDNPTYFDPTRPRTAPQLLVVDISQLDMETPLVSQPMGSRRLLRQIVEGLDWRALAAEVLRATAP